jgi:hypothetical protein
MVCSPMSEEMRRRPDFGGDGADGRLGPPCTDGAPVNDRHRGWFGWVHLGLANLLLRTSCSEEPSTLRIDDGRRRARCLVWRLGQLLTDKSVSLYDPQAYGPHTFFTTGFPRFLSIRGARGLQVFDLPSHSSY